MRHTGDDFIATSACNHFRPAVHPYLIVPAAVYTEYVQPELMHVKRITNGYAWERKIMLTV